MSDRIMQAKIRKILSDFDINQAPIPVEHITEALGIKISFAPSGDYSGILIRRDAKDGGGVLMGINSNDPPARRRFTIAHELGHYLLEKKTVSIDYRDINHNPNKSETEVKIDEFAANLLMPFEFIKKDFRKISEGGVFFEEHLVQLVDKYNVSREAMTWRLKHLGLIP